VALERTTAAYASRDEPSRWKAPSAQVRFFAALSARTSGDLLNGPGRAGLVVGQHGLLAHVHYPHGQTQIATADPARVAVAVPPLVDVVECGRCFGRQAQPRCQCVRDLAPRQHRPGANRRRHPVETLGQRWLLLGSGPVTESAHLPREYHGVADIEFLEGALEPHVVTELVSVLRRVRGAADGTQQRGVEHHIRPISVEAERAGKARRDRARLQTLLEGHA